jgi:hypothetical protein
MSRQWRWDMGKCNYVYCCMGEFFNVIFYNGTMALLRARIEEAFLNFDGQGKMQQRQIQYLDKMESSY